MVIPATRLADFERLWKLKLFGEQRYGQAFYNFMDFHKSNDPEVEEIYNAPYPDARAWIMQRLDPDN